jgi:hypothetical protein
VIRIPAWVAAGLAALLGALADIGAQLQQPDIHWTRAAIWGLVIGAITRTAGAIVRYATTPPPPPEEGAP